MAHPPGAGPPVRVNRPSIRPLVSPRAYRTTRLGVGRRSSLLDNIEYVFPCQAKSCDISRFLALFIFCVQESAEIMPVRSLRFATLLLRLLAAIKELLPRLCTSL